MKPLRIYLALVACLLAPAAFAQSPVASGIDSLDIYLNSKTLSFEKKFDKIYDHCYEYSELYTDKCLQVMRKMHKLATERNDSLRIARANFMIGYCYSCKENFVLSLEYYFKALPYAETHRDSTLMVPIYNNIGIAYSKQLQYKKAIGYFLKVVAIAEKKKNLYTMGVSYNNVAIEYQNLKQYSLSDKYLKKSIEIFRGNQDGFLSSIIMNRGVIRFEKGQYDSALVFYQIAKTYHRKYVGDTIPATISNNLGELYLKMGRFDSSLFYLKHTLTQIDTLNDKYSLRETYKHLAEVYHALGDNKKAYYYLKKHAYLGEMISDSESTKRTLASEANFQLLKKDQELRLTQQKSLHDKKQNRLYYIFGSIAGGLLVIALIISILRISEKKKANAILLDQKNRIQEQQNEITDSINYARNIQQSILPSDDYLQKTLKDYLLFYQPRDIVGGDFYFVETIGDRSYFAVVDCTGHGVPGGFMSILGFNGIQKCLHDFNLKHPAEILDALSKLVVKHFTHQGKQALRDGMDMALCCLYTENGKTMMEFAGANNPCWIIKKNSHELVEINANKQPIGYFENFKPFVNHTIELEKGDVVYLFSDGYADQFGGPSGKKFKYSQLKGLLQLGSMSMKERENMLKKTFEDWRSTYEQLDDVCLLGVSI